MMCRLTQSTFRGWCDGCNENDRNYGITEYFEIKRSAITRKRNEHYHSTGKKENFDFVIDEAINIIHEAMEDAFME